MAKHVWVTRVGVPGSFCGRCDSLETSPGASVECPVDKYPAPRRPRKKTTRRKIAHRNTSTGKYETR